MSKKILVMAVVTLLFASCGNGSKNARKSNAADKQSVVYFTKDISSGGLVRIYEALGRKAEGKVAVKISTGEAGGHNFLQPELIGELVNVVEGTIVECNTAYEGRRMKTEEHLKVIEEHGFTNIAAVDIMDAEGDMKIPVTDTKWLEYNIVGSHLKNYDFMINLAHFKGHAMGGFGGVLKNQSIGVASARGKANIHTAGKVQDVATLWQNLPEGWDKSPKNNDPFIESMAAAAQSVHNYFKDGNNIIYINVMNNISVDCDCDPNPAEPKINDIGIAASLDPVALDKFCLDKVFGVKADGGDNSDLVKRIKARHGMHIVDYAEQIGLGTTNYKVIDIDE